MLRVGATAKNAAGRSMWEILFLPMLWGWEHILSSFLCKEKKSFLPPGGPRSGPIFYFFFSFLLHLFRCSFLPSSSLSLLSLLFSSSFFFFSFLFPFFFHSIFSLLLFLFLCSFSLFFSDLFSFSFFPVPFFVSLLCSFFYYVILLSLSLFLCPFTCSHAVFSSSSSSSSSCCSPR